MNKSQASFIGACIGLVLLTFLIVNFGGYQLPDYVTGPISLFGSLVIASAVIVLIMRKIPHERLQEQQAEARKRYRQKPDPYLLGVDAARHHADFTLSRKEILFQCNRAAQVHSPEDAKEFMRGANHYIKTAFADPIHVEV